MIAGNSYRIGQQVDAYFIFLGGHFQYFLVYDGDFAVAVHDGVNQFL
jgi:hypothetical protein